MRIEKGGKLTNHSPIHNDIKRVFFDKEYDLTYGDFAVYVYIAMHIQYSENGRDGKPNGKQGYCYKTKVRMHQELSMNRKTLNKHLERLKRYGFIETRLVPNKYGGKPLEEYRLITDWMAYISRWVK